MMAKIKININSENILDSPAWKDESLTLESRGMLITLFANSQNAHKVADITSKSGLSEWTIRKGLVLLEKSGYLKRIKTKKKGKFDWDFYISDSKELWDK